MIKLVYCITRRADLTLVQFSNYWHDVHGPIGRRIPGLRRLVQSIRCFPASGIPGGLRRHGRALGSTIWRR